MKRILLFQTSLFCLCLLFSWCAAAASVTYRIDPTHTAVLWHINHFGFSNPSGKWMANGTLVLDEEKPENSKVVASIRVGDVITGLPELDEHLKGKAFFDVKQFPVASFKSDKVTLTGDKTADLSGMLTLRGISKPILLKVVLNKSGQNPITNKMSAGFTASANLKRSDFGMTTLIPGLSDEVILNIEVEAIKEK